MRNISQHAEWLSLIEVSGPFLTVSMLEKAFPQGLESVTTPRRQRLRAAYEEWRDAVDESDPLLVELHREWIRLVLMEILDYDQAVMVENSKLGKVYTYQSSEYAVEFSPDLVIMNEGDERPRLFVSIQPPKTELDKSQASDSWPASFKDRMILLCLKASVRVGLVTNGDQWMLVNAPIGSTSSHASWYARHWFQEPVTLKAFQSLLGVRRCFGPTDETLVALLEESLKNQEEVTNTLGEQVRRAVEVLVQCLDKADEDRNRELLHNVSTAELYEAGLTVMMRLVFVLCAEERGLLLLGDPVYDQCYAISTLRGQLTEDADCHGPEVLDRRYDAWSRLLAVFRAIYSGVEHESLRMPALGGSLFDPDRFPFLEGRIKGTRWRDGATFPLPIDNRTVLMLLDALQVLEQRGGALLLSYRALDVEQIGHVYEGLLEYTVARVPEITLGLIGAQKAKNPNLPLCQIESARIDGEQSLLTLLGVTQRSERAIYNALDRSTDETLFGLILSVCGGDTGLAHRIRPFANLLRTDAWGYPIVYRENALIVTLGPDRRETGTHYTPKSLTEIIVSNTLEPVVYHGPAEGKPRKEWRLRSADELLNLKICDPAMGSGAFLVQVCRWLAERVVESWGEEEQCGRIVTVDGDIRDHIDNFEIMPIQLDDRLIIAKRLVAERCLYGVDINPLAVELAKLSIWLVTLAKHRPFGFLDHNLRHGDSLLGIHRLDQLTMLSINPDNKQSQLRFFGTNIDGAVKEAIRLRSRLRKIVIKDVRDVEAMARLEMEAQKKVRPIQMIADGMIGEVLRVGSNTVTLNAALNTLSSQAEEFIKGNVEYGNTIIRQARKNLSIDLPDGTVPRKPFHWPLEFPEVFAELNGFDSIVGNPPFIGGRRMRGILGDAMINWLVVSWPHASMNADFCTFFFLRSSLLLREYGGFGLLATSTIGQGDTARTGLAYLVGHLTCTIRHAQSSFIWPGAASVIAAFVVLQKGKWNGVKFLNGCTVEIISPVLDDQGGWGNAQRLPCNIAASFQGSVLVGKGFLLTHEEAETYLHERGENEKVILPFLSGDDLNSHPEQKASRWVIDFRNASLEECERRWPELLERVRRLVKPQRDMTRREAHRKYWWHHGDKRPALYECIENRTKVFVIASVTKYVTISYVSAKQVFLNKVYVLDLPGWASFAALQSSFHDVWARRGSSTMGETLNYTPSDYFDTFPFLHMSGSLLESIGNRYHNLRKNIMQTRNEGLTNVYNLFHNSDEISEDIQELREMHREMDEAVAIEYGWGDIDLGHGFHETKQGVRYTISEVVRREVLQRLLKLNLEFYEKEVLRGVHGNISGKATYDKHGRIKQSKKTEGVQQNLFDNAQ